ncbi:hypothetical protein Pmani_027011 [Petrolisthes manimaculis]|uniref:Hexosyltransferase n=1 Tax=Petrolisthes manimaculis TaxID=1843537 RepID=A0AAE1P4K5_9EUCA|nr:hypothetical protein Pmani_027011 [Petrolisthes manimaculis]
MLVLTRRRRRRRICGSLVILAVVLVAVVPVSFLIIGTFFLNNTPTTSVTNRPAKQQHQQQQHNIHHYDSLYHHPADSRSHLPSPLACSHNEECPALLDKTMVAQLRNVTTKILLAGEGRGEVRGDRWTGESHNTGLTFPKSHDITIKFIVLEPNFCSVPDLQVIVYVHSAPANRKSRDAIRATWGHPEWFPVLRHKVIFVLGDPQNNNTSSELLDESWLYHDILLADFHDTYHNLSYKGVSSLWWLVSHCQGPTYVVKTDDDMFINIFALARLINAHGGDLSARVARTRRRKKTVGGGGGGGGGGEEGNGKNKGVGKRMSDNKEERWEKDKSAISGEKRESKGDETTRKSIGEEETKMRTIKGKEKLKKSSIVGNDEENKNPQSVKLDNESSISVDERTHHDKSEKIPYDNSKKIREGTPATEKVGIKNGDTKPNQQQQHHQDTYKSDNNTSNHNNNNNNNNNNNIENTVKESLKEEGPKIHCLVWNAMSVIRNKDNKWYVTPEEYPEQKYPPYCSGSAFLMNWEAAPALLKASSTSRFLWVDDVYLTGVLVKNSNVKLVSRNSLYELNTSKFLSSLIEGNRVFYHHTRQDVKTTESLWQMLVEKEEEVPVTLTAIKRH